MKFIYAVLMVLLASSCVQRPIHQGNELNKEKINMIQVGDSKFEVESQWGSPAILDTLHPNRVEYVEQVKDKDKKQAYVRGIIVEYDKILHVKSLKYFGF